MGLEREEKKRTGRKPSERQAACLKYGSRLRMILCIESLLKQLEYEFKGHRLNFPLPRLILAQQIAKREFNDAMQKYPAKRPSRKLPE